MTSHELQSWRKSQPQPMRPRGQRGPKQPYPSQVEAARMLNVTPRTLRAWEQGQRSIPEWIPKAIEALATRRETIKGARYW